MRVILFLFISLPGCAAFAQSQSIPSNFNVDSVISARQVAAIGKLFPAFTATSEGGSVSNELFKNKVVLINFWFEGCHPCMIEMEALNELQQHLKANKDFLLISFTWDNPEAINRVKDKFGLSFGVLSTTEKECRRLNFENGYPTNIILDRTGTIKYLHNGGSTKKEDARKFIMTTLLPEIKTAL